MSDLERTALVFKALSDMNRLKILYILKNGECWANDLLEELQISQPTLSHHMNILVKASLVYARKKGKWTYYSFNMRGIHLCEDVFDEFGKSTEEKLQMLFSAAHNRQDPRRLSSVN